MNEPYIMRNPYRGLAPDAYDPNGDVGGSYIPPGFRRNPDGTLAPILYDPNRSVRPIGPIMPVNPNNGPWPTPPAGPSWPNPARGLEQPGMSYIQIMTPVNMNDPAEVARYYQMYPNGNVTGGTPGGVTPLGNNYESALVGQGGDQYVPPTQPAGTSFTPAGPAGSVPTISGADQLANPRPFENVLGLTGVNQQQIAALREQTYGSQNPGNQPTLALQQIWGQPRNLAQSLILAGLGEQGAARFLQNTPFMQQANTGVGAGTAQGSSGFYAPQGRKLNVRSTLADMQSGSQNIPLMEGLASFSGQDPSSFWGDFAASLPKGSMNPLTRAM